MTVKRIIIGAANVFYVFFVLLIPIAAIVITIME